MLRQPVRETTCCHQKHLFACIVVTMAKRPTRLLAAFPQTALNSINNGRANAQMFHRSEEHTSELLSLMRNSYAVFCLKKKTNPMTMQHYTCTCQNETSKQHKHA